MPSSPAQVEDDRWATIVEPVTNSSLLDTLLAQLRTLSLLCSLLPVPSGPALNFIQSYATPILSEKVAAYCTDTGRDIEAIIARDDYLSSLSDLQFRNGLLSIQEYFETVNALYTFPSLKSHPEALVKSAESLLTLHHNLLLPLSSSPSTETMPLSWSSLSTALSNLTLASQLPDVSNLAAVHVLRGDVEMLRYQMGVQGWDISQKSADVLLKNAEVFYRGGKNVAIAAGEEVVEREGRVKEAVVKGVRGDGVGMWGLLGGVEGVERIVGEAVEDGVVTAGQLQGLGITGL